MLFYDVENERLTLYDVTSRCSAFAVAVFALTPCQTLLLLHCAL